MELIDPSGSRRTMKQRGEESTTLGRSSSASASSSSSSTAATRIPMGNSEGGRESGGGARQWLLQKWRCWLWCTSTEAVTPPVRRRRRQSRSSSRRATANPPRDLRAGFWTTAPLLTFLLDHLQLGCFADPIILDPYFDCDPIVSPEQPTREMQGFAYTARKFANEVDAVRKDQKPGKWLLANIHFVGVDADEVLHNSECKAAAITALAMKGLLELLESGLLKGQMPQDHTPMLMLDTVLSNNLIHWVPNPQYGIKPKAPNALPEGMSHLLLSSSFPIHQLLNLMVMLYPENSSTRMGHCKMHQDDRVPLEKRFDWDAFKKLIEGFAKAAEDFDKRLEKGLTWTEATSRRWDRFFENDAIMKAADEADLIFGAWRQDQYKAGCHLAIISAYVLHAYWYARSDRQAWLQRFLTAVTSVHAVHAPIIDSIKADWPVYQLWHGLYSLRRERVDSPSSAPLFNAELLLPALEQQLGRLQRSAEIEGGKSSFSAPPSPTKLAEETLFITQAWGWMSKYIYNVKSRFDHWGLNLLVLTDAGACSREDFGWC